MTVDTFALLKVVGQVGLPPASLVLALVIGAALQWTGWRRFGRVIVALAVAQTVVRFPRSPMA